MDETQNIIQNIVFDVSFNNRQQVGALQAKLSVLFNQRLIGTIDEVLQKHFAGPYHVSIDKIEIEIGALPYHSFEEEMLSRVSERLEDILYRYIPKHPLKRAVEGKMSASDNEYYLQIFEYYLLYGVLPWWASPGNTENFNDIFLILADTHKSALTTLIRRLSTQANSRKRLSYQLSVTAIKRLIEALDSTNAKVIIMYTEALQTKQAETQVVKAEHSEFKTATWDFVLTYMLQKRGSYFNTRNFVMHLLKQMAAHYNIAYFTLLEYFTSSIPAVINEDHRVGDTPPLLTIINSLYNDEFDEHEQPQSDELFLSQKELLQYILAHGSIPWTYREMSVTEIEQYWLNNTDQYNGKELLDIFSSFNDKRLLGSILSRFFSANFIRIIVNVLEPENGKVILSAIDNMYDVKHIGVPRNSYLNTAAEVTIVYLLSLGKTHFDPAAFLSYFTEEITKKFRVNYSKWREALAFRFSSMPDMFREFIYTLEDIAERGPSDKEYETPDDIPEQNTLVTQKREEDILFYFLEHGDLPPWVKHMQFPGIKQILANVLDTRHERLLHFLIVAQGNIKLTQHLLDITDDYIYGILIKRLFPRKYGMSSDLLKSLKSTKGVAGGKEIRAARFFIFAYLLRVSIIDKPDISEVRKLIVAANVYTGIEENLIISLLADASKNGDQQNEYVKLHKQLSTLSDNENKQSEQVEKKTQDTIAAEREKWPTIEFFLLNGYLPWWANDDISLETWMSTLATKDIELIAGKLKGSLNSIAAIERLMSITTSTVYLKILEQLVSDRPAILSFANYLSKDESGQKDLTRSMRIFILASVLHKKNLAGNEIAGHTQDILNSITKKQPKLANSILLEMANYAGKTGAGNDLLFDTVKVLYEEKKLIPFNPVMNVNVSKEPGMADLVYFIQQGKVPASYPVQDPLQFLKMMQAEQPDKLKQILGFMLKSSAASKNLISYNKADLLTMIFQAFFVSDRITATITNTAWLLSNIPQWRGRSNHALFWSETFAYFFQLKKTSLFGYIQLILDKFDLLPDTPIGSLLGTARQLLRMNATEHAAFFVAVVHITAAHTKVDQEKKKQDMPLKKEKAATEYYINNAGLILLHPFLPAYFEKAGLLSKGGLTDVENKARAVYLLQYLASGQEYAPEYEQVLNKILCGVELKVPLRKEVLLTEDEKALSESLLKNVIDQWRIIGNTSVAGLRESFLMRRGKLIQKDGAYELTVEQKSYDMLLDHLPWSIGIIKTSWMHQPLYILWK